MRVVRRAHFTLLEVVLSIFVLSLCLIPLLYPHYAILLEEKRFVREVESDRYAGLLYAEDLARYLRGVDWSSELSQSRELVVPWKGVGAERITVIRKQKPKDDPSYYLIKTTYRLTVDGKVKEYDYYTVLEKKPSSAS